MNKIKGLLIIFLYLLSLPVTYARGGKNDYELIWEEDFKGKSINTGKWSKITRGKPVENKGIAPNDTARFLTGGISTKGKFSICYGKVEVKAKLEAAQGAWPAIWMLPEKGEWPKGGEIDIMERLNHDDFVHQTIHTHYTHTLNEKQNPPHTAKAAIDSDGYNVYGVEILPDKIVFSVNGKTTHTYPKIETDKEGQFPFGTPYYILIDMQIEGAWVGKANPEELPVRMITDWVKVYKLK